MAGCNLVRACAWVALVSLGICACGGTKKDPDGGVDCEVLLDVSSDGLTLEDSCGRGSLRLLPAAKVGGAWLGAGLDGACVVEDAAVVCPTGAHSRVTAWVDDDGAWQVTFVTDTDAILAIEGLALVGSLELPGATAWLSNGFQSWSQSGALALGPPPSEAELASALAQRGDAEVLRAGTELSWWHTWVGGGELALVAGTLMPFLYKSWIRVHRTDGDDLDIWLVSGGAGEVVGISTIGEPVGWTVWHVSLSDDLHAGLQVYGDVLAARLGRPRVAAEAGWNSWYELWDGVDAAAVAANADLARQVLEPLIGEELPVRIVIDDGWQQAWGEWLPNDKFPDGIDGLVADLHDAGFEVGIWLAPLLVEEGSSLVAEHPDWFVGGAVFNHTMHGPMRVLDVWNTEVQFHLDEFISRIVGWDIDLLKIDFLFAGTWEGDRQKHTTGMASYSEALHIIRQAAGEDTMLLAVGAPGIPSLPYVDAWRLGGDIAFEPLTPSWHFAVNQARSIAARWPVCLAVQCDPDPPILRQLTRDEVGFGAWVVALAGGALFLSDDLRTLNAERWSWVPPEAAGAALSGQAAVPEDLVPVAPPARLTTGLQDQFTGSNTHVLPLTWRLPDGRRVGLNLEDEPVDREETVIPAHGAALLGGGS